MYRLNNREKIREQERQWRIKNPEKRRAQRRRYHLLHQDAINERKRRWHHSNPERAKQSQKRSHLKRLYGLTEAQYFSLLTEQRNRCKLCDCYLMKPFIDHDHETGKVRGILCPKCNTGIGLLDDSPERLRAAAAYLEKSK